MYSLLPFQTLPQTLPVSQSWPRCSLCSYICPLEPAPVVQLLLTLLPACSRRTGLAPAVFSEGELCARAQIYRIASSQGLPLPSSLLSVSPRGGGVTLMALAPGCFGRFVLHKMSAIFHTLRLGHFNFPTMNYHLADFFLSLSTAGL